MPVKGISWKYQVSELFQNKYAPDGAYRIYLDNSKVMLECMAVYHGGTQYSVYICRSV